MLALKGYTILYIHHLTRDLAEISVSLTEAVRAAQYRKEWSKLVEVLWFIDDSTGVSE